MPRKLHRRIDPRIVTLAMIVPAPLYAAGNEALGTLPLVLRAVGSLGGVLLLITLMALLVKRLRASRMLPAAHPDLRPVGRLGLGGRREVRLVQVRDRVLVLGVTEQHVEMLTELPADDPAAADLPANAGSNTSPVLRVLQKLASSP